MGLIDYIFGSNKGETTSDPKKTQHGGDDSSVSVRNSSTVVNHDEKNHDQIWSKTTVDTRTGDWKHEEGTHGPNYK